MRKSLSLAVFALAVAGCQESSTTGPDSSMPRHGSNPQAGACSGTVADYCLSTGADCPTYDQSIERHARRCAHGPTWTVQARECVGVYRAVVWQEVVLGGGVEYFDAGGRLVAAHLGTDYRAHCGGTSFDRTFGTVPSCPVQPAVTDLCRS